MLYEEAEWIGKELNKLKNSGKLKNVLNIGSSTSESWAGEQNHMSRFVINPLIESGIKLVNTDIKNGNGVDIVGDLTNDEFIRNLTLMNYDIVICTNLLEHVNNPLNVATNISKILIPNSFAIITVPHIYPYHPDPDDYLFRPDISKLEKLFPDTTVISAEIVQAQRAIWSNGRVLFFKNQIQVLWHFPKLMFLTILRTFTPFYKYSNWKKTAEYLPKMFKPFSVTCLVLQKNQNNRT